MIYKNNGGFKYLQWDEAGYEMSSSLLSFKAAQILATEWTQVLHADHWCPTWNARLCSEEN